jgi:hypothetical protein
MSIEKLEGRGMGERERERKEWNKKETGRKRVKV